MSEHVIDAGKGCVSSEFHGYFDWTSGDARCIPHSCHWFRLTAHHKNLTKSGIERLCHVLYETKPQQVSSRANRNLSEVGQETRVRPKLNLKVPTNNQLDWNSWSPGVYDAKISSTR